MVLISSRLLLHIKPTPGAAEREPAHRHSASEASPALPPQPACISGTGGESRVLVGRLPSGIMAPFSLGCQALVALACSESQTSTTKSDAICDFKHLSHVSARQRSPQNNGIKKWGGGCGAGTNTKTEALLVFLLEGEG